MITISTTAAHLLRPEHAQAWDQIQRAEPAWDSPFFRPEFTAAVAAVRGDVKVAALEENGEPVGFWPFQASRWGIAHAVGRGLCDFQGVVARADAAWSCESLLRGCELAGWSFDHLLATQSQFAAWHELSADSPFIDISAGFDAYYAARVSAGAERLRTVQRKARKAEREVGSIQLTPHTADPQVFAALLRWKSQQYRRTQATDVFAFPWTVQLLERILREPSPHFSAMLSALHIGDSLAAVHFGIRSGGVLHYWFPVYDVELSQYSPGLILMVELLKAAPSLGIRRIDLGRGQSEFKSSVANGSTLVAEGSAVRPSLVGLAHRGWRRTRRWVKASPLRSGVRVAGRLTRPLRGWLAFR